MRFRRACSRGVAPAALAALTALAAAGCGGDDPVRPTVASGAYTATAFTAASDGTTTDVLAAGGSLALVLTPQGTTTGRLVIPAAVSGDGDVDADLTGTWTQSGGTVRFSHAADTFLRDLPFAVQGEALVGDRTFGGTRVRVTLTRAP